MRRRKWVLVFVIFFFSTFFIVKYKVLAQVETKIILPNDCINYGSWNEDEKTCYLTHDISQSVEIIKDGITLDCQGKTISGKGTEYGINLSNRQNVSIRNCQILNFDKGIILSSSNKNILENNTVSRNNTGIYLHSSNENFLKNNLATNNLGSGIVLDYFSSRNVFRGNRMNNNKYNFQSFGYENDIDKSNLVDGKEIYYLVGASNLIIDSLNVGTVYCIRCQNVTIKNLQLSNNFFGIFLSSSENIKIENNKINSNNTGIFLTNSNNNTFFQNIIEENETNIELRNSKNNLFDNNIFGGKTKNSGNLIFSNGSHNNKILNNQLFNTGIFFFYSGTNTIAYNQIYQSFYGLYIYYSYNNEVFENLLSENTYSIYLSFGSKNLIYQNKIQNSKTGLYIQSWENTFYFNTLLNNTTGLLIEAGDKNLFYHNNFLNNLIQVIDKTKSNFFDKGYPIGGNYWSDYRGKDEKSGENQDQEGPDGIGDEPYTFSGGKDQYPIYRENGWLENKWEFNNDFYYNLDENLETFEGRGSASGTVFLFPNELRIEGKVIISNNFENEFPEIYLIATDGYKKEFSSTTISFDLISFSQIRDNFYLFSFSMQNPPKPQNNGHYEIYLKIRQKSFFINTNSKINKNYLPLITFQNQPPIPIIEFFPKFPVKGTRVTFDGAKSFDFDGEIVSFEWQIAGSTFYGTTTEFTFDENGEYQVTLTVTDNDSATSSTSTTIKVEPFSFAIITDLHIGRGYSDYGGEGFDDEDNGEEYYLTQRLRNVVDWINKHRENYSFKFVAVLGDIADTAEKSEFCKAKEILDQLEIPYIPIFGNHDVWPYTEKESAPGPSGEDFFERIFWSTSSIPCENASSTKNFEILLREFNFKRDIQNPKFKNFAFNFGGIHFIGLDFNSREKEEKWYLGPTGAKGEAVNHLETIEWLKRKLNELEGKEPVIILSHEPFAKPYSRSYFTLGKYGFIKFPTKDGNFSEEELEEIKQILQDYENISESQQILANFGGHIHGFEKAGKELKFFGQFSPIDLYFDANWQYPPLSTVPVLTTEAIMVGGNEKNLDNKGLVRIVKIEEKEKINFSDIEFKEPALNPYITFEYKIRADLIYPCVVFVPQTFTKREIDYFLWDFGDGKTATTSPLIFGGKIEHCYSPFKIPAIYNATLIAIDKETNKSELITKKVEIREGIIPKIIKIPEVLKEKTEFILQELGEKATEFGRTMRDSVLIKVKHSPSTPVGIINVHFENATEDIDLTQIKVDTDLKKKKSLLYMPEWPPEIERSKILFIPK